MEIGRTSFGINFFCHGLRVQYPMVGKSRWKSSSSQVQSRVLVFSCNDTSQVNLHHGLESSLESTRPMKLLKILNYGNFHTIVL